MRRPSFIFSSERPYLRLVVGALTVVLFLFVVDRVAFLALFPLYDQWLRVDSGMKNSELLVVGSSHIEADLDLKLLRSLTGETVGLFSVPGVSLIGRYYAVYQRLKLESVPKPKFIILETSKLVFHPYRYNDDVTDYLMAYRNKGLFQDFVNLYFDKHPDRLWLNLFETYSLNGAFTKFTDPGNIVRFVTENFLSNDEYMRFRSWARRWTVAPAQSCLTHPPAEDLRPAQWVEVNRKYGYDSRVDPRRVDYLKKIIALTQSEGIELILVEPPFFRFKDQVDNDGFDNVRAVLSSLESSHVHYVRIQVPNNSCLFNDDGHLGTEGQEMFTKSLARYLM